MKFTKSQVTKSAKRRRESLAKQYVPTKRGDPQLNVRLTIEERNAVVRSAKRRNMTVHMYVRLKLTDKLEV